MHHPVHCNQFDNVLLHSTRHKNDAELSSSSHAQVHSSWWSCIWNISKEPFAQLVTQTSSPGHSLPNCNFLTDKITWILPRCGFYSAKKSFGNSSNQWLIHCEAALNPHYTSGDPDTQHLPSPPPLLTTWTIGRLRLNFDSKAAHYCRAAAWRRWGEDRTRNSICAVQPQGRSVAANGVSQWNEMTPLICFPMPLPRLTHSLPSDWSRAYARRRLSIPTICSLTQEYTWLLWGG